MTHTVLIEHIRVDGRGGRKTFNVGDKITPSDHELRWFANRFSPLAQGSDANQEADPPKQPEDEPKKSEAEVTPDEEVKAENEGDEAPPKQPEDEPKKSEAEVTPDEEVKAENEGDEAPPKQPEDEPKKSRATRAR